MLKTVGNVPSATAAAHFTLMLIGVPPAAAPVLHGRLAAQGPGKESTTGHWELMGVTVDRALPTYPEGFPDAVLI